jgi:micrococcal nuclease
MEEPGRRVIILLVCGAILVACALILASVAVSGLGEQVIMAQQKMAEAGGEMETVVVARVLDGDTIELADRRRVRYLGLDAPEAATKNKPAQCFADLTTEENKRLVLSKPVRLEKDASNRDKYGRLLRYVYVESADGEEIFLNDYLLRQGFARVLSIPPDRRYERQFQAAVEEAKFQQRGLWGACD